MKKFLQKKLKDEKGMTLIELLAVIVIIAIIAAIAIPAIGNIIENSRVGTMKSDNLNAIAAAELFLLDNPTETTVELADIVGSPATTGATPTAATPSYIDSAGSLQSFVYTVSSKTVTSTAQQGTMNMVITGTGTTKEDINDYDNSNREAENGIKAAKGSLPTGG